ncbi:hypothetical protein K1T71_001146 [Dendrolimus kikuchii]|uniref:Uncharacterized protein n=3 Tax=Dendrolimus kikuchii TaxID=765133 RepID=A0ACC1DH48_9NEOP|nr:hypothetical protein K1T71_001146 [Dendrolimus kikuchii]
MLAYWYEKQTNNVRWGNKFSADSGVRQGGVTSPDLFNCYINELIEELSGTPVGLRLGDRFVNNLSYADDMVLLSPSIKGMRKLLSICERYAQRHQLVYNAKKTEMLIFRSGRGPSYVPDVYIGGQPVKIVNTFKYLGHILSSDRKDNHDIERQRRCLSVCGNMLARRFFKASKDTKIHLFRTFCQTFYTCQLWTECTRRSLDGIRVQYNNIFRHLMGFKRYCSASSMFLEARLNTFCAIRRSRIANFLTRVEGCRNSIIAALASRLHQTKMYWDWLQIAA